MDKKLTILGFAGSLRRASYNRGLLRAAALAVPAEATLETFDRAGIPIFKQEEETDPPERVREFKARIRAADALLIATPEYNNSVPGVLKNAIDWASRPYAENPFDGKPVALMGASTGRFGTVRAQSHPRQTFAYLNMHPLNAPVVMVSQSAEKFDAGGNLRDPVIRELIGTPLANLVAWTRRLQGG